MKRFFAVFILVVLLTLSSCSILAPTTKPTSLDVEFQVNLLDRSNDTFKVTVIPPVLSDENNIFQFVSTSPGTFQTMDIGRFVKSFKAYDKKGNELNVSHIGTNQFQFESPKKIAKISYEISETWDTPVEENDIHSRYGTSIENDHVLINGQAVFGFFKGKQSNRVRLKLQYPTEWQIGTSLKKSSNGYYTAKSFDRLADSPILLGYLTRANTNIQGTSIDVYTYSKTGRITAPEIMETLKPMLESASMFIDGLPVDRYAFIFHFEDKTNGAWEHSYSSEYIYREADWRDIKNNLLAVAAHQFFHIVTPLNLHSTVIDKQNYTSPLPSKHLWLYEGVTEWASHMMMFRANEQTINQYLQTIEQKEFLSKNRYNDNYSLVDIALTAYTSDGQKQYGNVYMKGAIIASLLDLKLIELSKGSYSLMDIINRLSKKYGPSKPFNEETFFEDFTNQTEPEIADFFDKYIIHSEPLPIQEYYNYVGIAYNEKTNKFSVIEEPSEEQLKLRSKWLEPLRKRGISLFLPQTSYINYVGSMDSTIDALYEVISGDRGKERNWDFFKFLFKPDGKLIPTGKAQDGTYKVRYLSPNDYAKSAETWMLENGFFEREINRVVNTYGNITQVFSTYEAFRNQTDAIPFMRGVNSIQLLFDGQRWWVINIYWTQETPENPIPPEYLPRAN